MDTIDEVLEFVEKNPEYRAQIGVIKFGDGTKTYLAWAALPRDSGDSAAPWIPAMRSIQKLNPSAHWVPLTADELQDYLNGRSEPAFAERTRAVSRRA
ncbi:hypothetical protein [Reinekea blandensis]|uniref:Uncharacterized protein n=1 Tax=Reinekea blandensis MED297 TaxID=314283 RepID=A4BIE6_9GAMM|nr:hypothetical protein [Reinekea blandensis]EAR08153.1 hypothetical protein MED297_00655 [Reinekea sp. MED297] [Reinekea blandensis MED297]